jgi:putative DNA primase/helicase
MNIINTSPIEGENNVPKHSINYTTRLCKNIYATNSLNELLKNINEIDFKVAYHEGTDTEEYILSLSEKLQLCKDKEDRKELTEKIKVFDPKPEEKISIIIENMLSIAEENGYGLGSINNVPHYFNNFHWESVSVNYMKDFLSMVAEKTGINHYKATKTRFKDDLYKQFISTSTIPPHTENNKVMINLSNGTFVCSNNKYEFKGFDSEDLLTYQLPFEFDKNAKAPMFLNFLNEVMPEKEAQMVMCEYIGYIFAKNLKLEKCLVLVGTGANGKSVFGDIICALLGKKNYAAYSLGNLCDKNGYYRAEIGSILLCYSSEMGSKNSDSEIIKQLFSNEPISARSPFGKPITITNYCRFMFNTNLLPKDMEQTPGFFRRFIFLIFDKTIPENKRIPDLAGKIIENELSGVFNWVLEGLDRLLIQKKFTTSAHVEKAFEKVKRESNSVSLFLDENGYKKSLSNYIVATELYPLYEEYCKTNGHYKVNKTEFLRRLENENIIVKRKATDGATWIYCTNHPEIDLSKNQETMDIISKFASGSINNKTNDKNYENN